MHPWPQKKYIYVKEKRERKERKKGEEVSSLIRPHPPLPFRNSWTEKKNI
jgi:hypothetical protein